MPDFTAPTSPYASLLRAPQRKTRVIVGGPSASEQAYIPDPVFDYTCGGLFDLGVMKKLKPGINIFGDPEYPSGVTYFLAPYNGNTPPVTFGTTLAPEHGFSVPPIAAQAFPLLDVPSDFSTPMYLGFIASLSNALLQNGGGIYSDILLTVYLDGVITGADDTLAVTGTPDAVIPLYVNGEVSPNYMRYVSRALTSADTPVVALSYPNFDGEPGNYNTTDNSITLFPAFFDTNTFALGNRGNPPAEA